jgi:hypothetical protein
MIIAALIVFGALLVAWTVAPAEPRVEGSAHPAALKGVLRRAG